jgi:prepilin-type N-terminal cleavage/methylation domain-containing protein
MNMIQSDHGKEIRDAGQKGFSLIEMMVASIILLIGLMSVAGLIGYSISSNVSSKNDTIAVSAAELELERLKSLDFSSASLGDGGSTLDSNGNIATTAAGIFSGSPVASYSSTVSLTDSDQVGKTVNYDVRWNITSINGMKKITVAAQRTSSNSRFLRKPAQLVFFRTP